MKQFQNIGVFQHPAQIGRRALPHGHLDKMRVTVPARHLDHAQAVTMRVQAHGFTINRHNRAKIKTVGQIVLIEVIRHFILDYTIAKDLRVPVARFNLSPWNRRQERSVAK